MSITFLHPTQVTPALKDAMSRYESVLKSLHPSASIEIHSDWSPVGQGGHVQESQHFTGNACDFDVKNVKLFDAWMILERIREVGGIGIYPFWKTKGLHADVRPAPYRARWGRLADESYVDVGDAFAALVIG